MKRRQGRLTCFLCKRSCRVALFKVAEGTSAERASRPLSWSARWLFNLGRGDVTKNQNHRTTQPFTFENDSRTIVLNAFFSPNPAFFIFGNMIVLQAIKQIGGATFGCRIGFSVCRLFLLNTVFTDAEMCPSDAHPSVGERPQTSVSILFAQPMNRTDWRFQIGLRM